MNDVRCVTVRALADRTGLSERTLRKMIADGRLPVIRPLGLRVVRIPEEAVRRLMNGAGEPAPRPRPSPGSSASSA